MKKFLSLSIFVFIFSLGFLNAQTPDPYEPEMIKAFADDLFQNGFWEEAESEYKRYLFTYDNAGTDTEVIFTLATIYHTKKNLDGALWLNNNFASAAPVEISEKLFINASGLAFLQRDKELFKNITDKARDDYSPMVKLMIPLSVSLLDKNLPLATELLNTLSMEFKIFLPAANYAKSIKTKSPGLALTLSLFLPGSGKWYTGSFTGFATDFLTVGGFTAGAIYTGIKSEWKDWRPYVFGTCALVFYISDVYGSYKSAQRYNETQYRILCEYVDRVYEEIF